jgi:hypothetical protein
MGQYESGQLNQKINCQYMPYIQEDEYIKVKAGIQFRCYFIINIFIIAYFPNVKFKFIICVIMSKSTLIISVIILVIN